MKTAATVENCNSCDQKINTIEKYFKCSKCKIKKVCAKCYFGQTDKIYGQLLNKCKPCRLEYIKSIDESNNLKNEKKIANKTFANTKKNKDITKNNPTTPLDSSVSSTKTDGDSADSQDIRIGKKRVTQQLFSPSTSDEKRDRMLVEEEVNNGPSVEEEDDNRILVDEEEVDNDLSLGEEVDNRILVDEEEVDNDLLLGEEVDNRILVDEEEVDNDLLLGEEVDNGLLLGEEVDNGLLVVEEVGKGEVDNRPDIQTNEVQMIN